jgi:hypothetical protein
VTTDTQPAQATPPRRATMAAVGDAAAREAESMAVDEGSTKDETAESVIARVVRAVTQPGGMNVDWKKVRAGGAVIAGISVIHGFRHRRWRYVHSVGVVLGIAAAAAARLKDKYVGVPDHEVGAPENE